jgi:hypothetical protein
MTIQVFDPPMCCSTGICGPSVDTGLIRFAADLEWLADQGVDVQRFNLSQQPGVFATTPIVKAALSTEGNACLPMVIVNGEVVCKGSYPSRQMLAAWARLGTPRDGGMPVMSSCCASGPKRTGCC